MITRALGIATIATAFAIPAASFASTFAYVDTSGEVKTVDASDASTALTTAPSIGTHSGVILLQDGATSL